MHLIKGQSVHGHFPTLQCSSITDALKTLWNQMDSLKRLIVHDLMYVRKASESRQSKKCSIFKRLVIIMNNSSACNEMRT